LKVRSENDRKGGWGIQNEEFHDFYPSRIIFKILNQEKLDGRGM
jgi:hypothetical protein